MGFKKSHTIYAVKRPKAQKSEKRGILTARRQKNNIFFAFCSFQNGKTVI
jgi:hypothetical protein